MNTEEKKIIVDERGKSLTRMSFYERITAYLNNNLKRIVEIGVPITTILSTFLGYLATIMYANEYSSFYGIHKRYFNGIDIFWQKLAASIFIVCFAVLTLVFLSRYKKNSKIKTVFAYIGSVLLLIFQNICFVVPMFGKYFFNAYVIVVILIVTTCSTFMLAYYFVVRNREKEWSKLGEVLFTFSIACYAFSIGLGVTNQMAIDAEGIVSYEIIGENMVVISEYEDLLLIMECSVKDDKLNINKGKYSFVQKEGAEIEFRTFEAVRCEPWAEVQLVE